ncbi:hypothetical protein ON010_g8228 [Phytophthora cinnamomi]|nr:hypothetical protein ON010_g8228 [Phytophthora cinnamomi]
MKPENLDTHSSSAALGPTQVIEKVNTFQEMELELKAALARCSMSRQLILESNFTGEMAAGNANGIECTLLTLLHSCVNENQRELVKRERGIQVLTNFVRNGRTFFTQLYALECLKWFALSAARVSKLELSALRSCMEEASKSELVALLHDGHGTEIAPIVALLRDGADVLRECAAYALGYFAYSDDAEESMVEEGAVALIVGLVKGGTVQQNRFAANMLGVLANYDPASSDIIREGAVPALITVLRGGTDEQTEAASHALRYLAVTDENELKSHMRVQFHHLSRFFAVDLGNKRNVPNVACTSILCREYWRKSFENEVFHLSPLLPLVAVLRDGTDMEMCAAALALGNLADSSRANHAELARKEFFCFLWHSYGRTVETQ